MVIVCNICQVFVSMNAQNVLDHWVKCKVRHNIEHMEHEAHEGCGNTSNSPKKKKSQVTRTKGSV